jgi:HSP20 family protein
LKNILQIYLQRQLDFFARGLILKVKKKVDQKEVLTMAITLWRKKEPFDLMTNFEQEIDRWFGEDWFGMESLRSNVFGDFLDSTWTPAVDIEEKDDKYVLKAELPGLKKEDIHVELKNGYLTLRGERNMEHEDRKKNYHRIERAYGSFERRFMLPDGVKESDIHAKYKDGVLELTVPIPEQKKSQVTQVKID